MQTRCYTVKSWRKLGMLLLETSGVNRHDARAIADALITGSLRGVDSHGVRNLPYFTQKRRGRGMKIMKETTGTALLDAGNKWGPVSAKKSMEIALLKARKNGIGSCCVVNGDWITNLSHFSMMAINSNMIGMVFAREGPVCAPWGGTKPIMGTNPMSIAIPTAGSYPIVLDFATTMVAQGHIKSYLLEGKPLPEGWLIDRRGAPVKGYDLTLEEFDDFWKKNGSLLPFGTYKGYGINVAIDVLCGALNLTGTGSRAKGQGVLTVAINIRSFVPFKKFVAEVSRLITEIKSSPRRPGFDEILLPGEREHRIAMERNKYGIPIDDASWQEIIMTSRGFGLDAETIVH